MSYLGKKYKVFYAASHLYILWILDGKEDTADQLKHLVLICMWDLCRATKERLSNRDLCGNNDRKINQ